MKNIDNGDELMSACCFRYYKQNVSLSWVSPPGNHQQHDDSRNTAIFSHTSPYTWGSCCYFATMWYYERQEILWLTIFSNGYSKLCKAWMDVVFTVSVVNDFCVSFAGGLWSHVFTTMPGSDKNIPVSGRLRGLSPKRSLELMRNSNSFPLLHQVLTR